MSQFINKSKKSMNKFIEINNNLLADWSECESDNEYDSIERITKRIIPINNLKDKIEDEIENKIENKNNKYIIEICNIPDFINQNILRKYVKNDIESNKDYFDDINITYRISDPKKAEWIIYKSINNSKLVSSGNNSVDIIINDIGIDISVLTLTGNNTNEKSLMQNFTTGNKLDELFLNKNGTTAVDIFKNKFLKKYDNKYKEIYYIIFICHKKHIYLSCFKLNLENIKFMEFSCFSKSCKNILLNNFIDKNYGNVKLYKSKKRLELRIDKNILLNLKSCINVY
jgi:hypothetical protein